MPAQPRLRRRSRSRLWDPERAGMMPVCVILLLAGLFGMHGLSDHGLPESGANAMAAPMAELPPPTVGSHTMAHHATAAHTIAPHPTAPHPTAPHPTAPHTTAHHATAHHATAAPKRGPVDTRVEPVPTGRHGSMGAMAGVCLALLAGLLLGLTGWLSVRRRPMYARPLRRPSLARPRARDPDPPSLTLLSVWRC